MDPQGMPTFLADREKLNRLLRQRIAVRIEQDEARIVEADRCVADIHVDRCIAERSPLNTDQIQIGAVGATTGNVEPMLEFRCRIQDPRSVNKDRVRTFRQRADGNLFRVRNKNT